VYNANKGGDNLKGNDVKQIRKEAKLTQAELASLLGVTVTTVSQWERGATSIHPLMAEGIKSKTRHLVSRAAA
jgi:DNA-binding transcriptional regulator YiaG